MSKNDVRTVKAQEERDERGEAAEMKIGSPVKPVAGRLLGAEAGWGAGRWARGEFFGRTVRSGAGLHVPMRQLLPLWSNSQASAVPVTVAAAGPGRGLCAQTR